MSSNDPTIPRLFLFWLLAASCTMAGCRQRGPSTYTVSGQVTFPDDTPVNGGMVEFESAEPETSGLNARGQIGPDGSFSLTTVDIGEGAVSGCHRAIVRGPYHRVEIEEGQRAAPSKFDRKFRSYETSGLEFEVQKQPNHFAIVVTRPVNNVN